MADPERGLWERSIFKEGPQFLKSNRISLAYGITSNNDQTLVGKSCFIFFLYREICWFCAIFGRFGGGRDRVWPLWIRLGMSWLPAPARLIGICVCPLNLKDDVCTDYFQGVQTNCPLHRRIISQIQIKRSGVGVEVVWSTPTRTPTPGSLPRLWATPTPSPAPTPHPWMPVSRDVAFEKLIHMYKMMRLIYVWSLFSLNNLFIQEAAKSDKSSIFCLFDNLNNLSWHWISLVLDVDRFRERVLRPKWVITQVSHDIYTKFS